MITINLEGTDYQISRDDLRRALLDHVMSGLKAYEVDYGTEPPTIKRVYPNETLESPVRS